MSLLNFLFWIFLIIIITRLIRFSFFIGKVQNRSSHKYQSPDEAKKKEGTTTVKYIPEKEEKPIKTSSTKDEDYIDYEEVK
jgi:hypothetical protein